MPSDALSYLEATAYGCIQGLTEFLPVSSSGHLALAHQLGLGHVDDVLMRPFSVFLHVATLLAVLIGFRREIYIALSQLDKTTFRNACLSIVPAVIVGFTCADLIGHLEGSMALLASCFLLTAVLLLISDRFMFLRALAEEEGRMQEEPYDPEQSVLPGLSIKQAIWVGLGQALALLPGVSRSGSSLCAGILSGVPAQRAFAYSFLVGIPLIAGAALHEYLLADEYTPMIEAIGWPCLLWAMLCSLVSGILAIIALRYVIKNRCLSYFGVYCGVLAGICLVFVITG